jgi:hypothetical protein
MNHRNNFTGQRVDSRDHNDNAPPRYSAPSAKFKEILAYYADQNCRHCSGTGYLGRFKHVCAGRCFKCIKENVFEQTQEEFDQNSVERTGCDEMAEIYLAVCGNGGGGPAYLSDGMWIKHGGQIYDAAYGRAPSSEGRSSALRSTSLAD